MNRAMALMMLRRQQRDLALYGEFLEPARGLMAGHASPIHRNLARTICSLFALALAGAWFGHVDIYAEAPARLQPLGRSKVVQPMDSGTVEALNVANGSAVRANQVLVQLDPTEAVAAQTGSAQSVAALAAEIARRRLAIDASRMDDPAASLPEAGPAPDVLASALLTKDYRAREQTVLDADVAQLRVDLADVRGKLGQNQARLQAAGLAVRTAWTVAGTLGEQLGVREKLRAAGWESLVNVLSAREDLERQEMALAAARGELMQAQTEHATLAAELDGVRSRFADSNATALKQAQDQLDQARQALVKAADHARHTDIRAPIDGTVQELAVTTLGQVVTTGQQLMTIVPRSPKLEMEALVENKDIGFVRVGQTVVVKLKTFPYTRYGTLSGQVIRVSHDAVPSREAASNQDQEATPQQAQSADASSVPNTQDLVYPVTVALDRASIDVDGATVPLTPGLQATVDIKTGERRALSYLLSPVTEIASGAMHER